MNKLSVCLVVLAFVGASLAHRGMRPPRIRLLCDIESSHQLPGFMQPVDRCPDGSSCTIGPILAQHGGFSASLKFCDALDENGNLRLFSHACRIELADGTVIEREVRHCNSEECCNKGPLTGYNYNGQEAVAYYPVPPMNPRGNGRPRFGNGQENLEDVASIDTY